MYYQLKTRNWVKARARWIERRSIEETEQQKLRREARRAELIAAGKEIAFSTCPSGISVYIDSNKYRFKLSVVIGLSSMEKIPFFDPRPWATKGTWNKWYCQHHYQIKSSSLLIASYCVLDLCDRLLEAFKMNSIPVIIKLAPLVNVELSVYREAFSKALDQVNEGAWDFDKKIDFAFSRASKKAVESGFDGEGSFENYIRHLWTPYDYCWQTKKMNFVEANSKYGSILLPTV